MKKVNKKVVKNKTSECKCTENVALYSPNLYDWVKCEYKDKCSDYPHSCSACKHKYGKKQSYYEPDVPSIYITSPYVYPEWGTTNLKYV